MVANLSNADKSSLGTGEASDVHFEHRDRPDASHSQVLVSLEGLVLDLQTLLTRFLVGTASVCKVSASIYSSEKTRW